MTTVIDMGDFSIDETATPGADAGSKTITTQAPPALNNGKMFKEDSKLVKEEFKKTITHKTPEGIKEHQEHVLMLSRYGSSERFGNYLKGLAFDLKHTALRKKTLPDLQELLERVRTSVANKTVSDVWSDSLLGGLSLGENVITMTKLGETIRIHGLSESLKDDETFMDLLEEMRLENQNLSYVSPYVRIVYSILTAGARVHGMNTLMAKHKAKSTTSVSTPADDKEDDAKKIITKQPNDGIVDLDQ